MSDLELLRSMSQELYHQEADLLRRHSGTWSDGTTCRFSVERLDPVKLANSPLTASLLKVRIHPDDSRPAPGSTVAYLGCRLSVGTRSDPSDFTGQTYSVARVIDERVYPTHATHVDGPSIRLRIVARGALPFTVGAGLQDVQGAPVSSHVGFVEPGVKLHGGDVLTLDSGDKFTVVPPLQHDLLGDTVGLSWQGDQTVPNLTPDPTLDAPGKPDPVPGDDSYWHTP
ncbi:hypothetical protein Q0M94_02185 [Deinococcus radiomollis]|uniref:hypothetical protein n=1 Tax=Deinococcus radiomollis TaxID=468916 RepID=UPI0038915292